MPEVLLLLIGFPDISPAVQATMTRTDIKGVGWFNILQAILSSFLNLKPTHLINLLKMSHTNATRLPSIVVVIAYVGDDVNQILTRGER